MDFKNLIKLDKDGLSTPSYEEIKSIMIDLVKETNGIDVDLTGANAQMIDLVSTLVFNATTTIAQLYRNLDPDYANGVFLNSLVSMDGLHRKLAEPSYLYATIKYTGNLKEKTGQIIKKGLDITTQKIILKDENGNLWTWEEGMNWDKTFNTKFKQGEPVTIRFKSERLGKQERPWGLEFDNVDFFELENNLRFYSGNDEENDNELRKRRLRELGGDGNTTYAGLMTTLLEMPEIKDVLLYDNNTAVEMSTRGGYRLPKSNIFLIIKLNALATENRELNRKICETIFNKIPTGITTCKPVGYGGNLYETTFSLRNSLGFEQKIYWFEPVDKKIAEVEINFKFHATNKLTRPNIKINKITEEIRGYLSDMKLKDSLIGQKVVKHLNDVFFKEGFFFQTFKASLEKNGDKLSVIEAADCNFTIGDGAKIIASETTEGYYKDYTLTIN